MISVSGDAEEEPPIDTVPPVGVGTVKREAWGSDEGNGGIGPAERFPGVYARTRRFSVGAPRNFTVIDHQRILFLRTRSGEDPTLCLWLMAIDGAKYEERLLVDPAGVEVDDDLPPAERARRERARESAGGIVSYAVDRDGTRVCFSLAGTLFVLDLEGGEPEGQDRSGGIDAPPVAGPVFDPRLSPDGSRVAYVSGNDLRVVDLATGSDRALATAEAGDPISWGRAEFVAAEEMQRSRGYWWSPSGQQILATRVDESRVARWWIADPAHPDRPPNEIRYPAAGTANAEVELHLIDVERVFEVDDEAGHGADGRALTTAIDWADGDRFEYLANVVWPGDHKPLVVRQTRDQRLVSIAEVTVAEAGATCVEVRLITDDIWVELIPSSPTVSEAGLLTIEDLPSVNDPSGQGRRALVLDGRPLTGQGSARDFDGDDLQVRSVAGVLGHWAIVTAWTEPTEIQLLAIDLTGTDDPVPLTTTPGVHSAVFGRGSDDDRLTLVVTSAEPNRQGAETSVRTLVIGDGGPELDPAIATIEDRSLRSPIQAFPSFHHLGPDRLASALFLPSNYDGSSKLPVLLDPYGGPHAQRVLKTNTGHLVSQWFAEQGFAVLVTDGRGTPGRGPAWERQVWGDLAGPVLHDQIEALDAAADEFEILDLERVAVRGWSFGGYLAALAVLRAPDRFHAAIAGAPVTSWDLYDTHYTERYLGRPDIHPRHYQITDLTAEADRLVRPLLVIHGLADDNVVAAHTLRLSTALLAARAPHRVLPLSGVTHMTPQEVVAENLLWLQLEFLRQSLELSPT